MSVATPSTLPRLAAALALAATSCTTAASGEVRGGEVRPGYDAAAPAKLEVPITEPTYEDAPATSWRGLYRDFFGRRAMSSCSASMGTCHSSAASTGATSSNFVCADADSCWTSLRTATDRDPRVSDRALVEDADVATPGGAYLFRVIRYRTADGTLVPNRGMPEVPNDFAFMPDDIDRMQTWIRNGAKND